MPDLGAVGGQAPDCDLYRVFPSLRGAGEAEPGGPLYVARERQGSGRIDNPETYGVLYLAATPVAAVAERFQGFRGRRLTPRHLKAGMSGREGVWALGSYRSRRVRECDLDDPRPLLERELRPSDIATRDRLLTQRWAREIHDERRWPGVRYWSVLEAKWPVVARWSWEDLVVEDVEPLTLFHPAVREAAGLMAISI